MSSGSCWYSLFFPLCGIPRIMTKLKVTTYITHVFITLLWLGICDLQLKYLLFFQKGKAYSKLTEFTPQQKNWYSNLCGKDMTKILQLEKSGFIVLLKNSDKLSQIGVTLRDLVQHQKKTNFFLGFYFRVYWPLQPRISFWFPVTIVCDSCCSVP